MRRHTIVRCAVVAWIIFAGCGKDEAGPTPGATSSPDRGGSVVVYTALDREFSEPILTDCEKTSGVDVQGKFDVESTKTVGQTNLIVAEASSPRCDLFWNNEILNTLSPKEKGLLAPFTPSHTAYLPETFRVMDKTWYGFAAQGRVLIVDTKLDPEAERPKGINDLTDPKWKGKIGIAKPLFGTTATHAASLFAAWSDEKAMAYFRALKANDAKVLSGNKQVATDVGASRLAFGMTDTDDAMGEVEAGSPVVIIYPDRAPDGLGTLFIFNTLSVLKDAPHPKAAEALVDHLLSPEVEATLAEGPSAQIPLRKSTDVSARVETPTTVHAMPVDFEAAAKV